MFAIGWCQGAVQGAVRGAPDHVCHWPVSGCCRVLSRVLRIMFAIGRCQGAVQGAVQGCCSGCSGSCLPLGGVRVLSRVLRIMFAIGRCQGAVQGAVHVKMSKPIESCLPCFVCMLLDVFSTVSSEVFIVWVDEFISTTPEC